jgi:stringent starvation protein B
VIGLITENNEKAYREVVRALAEWCQDNNLSLNLNKTKEVIVDYRTAEEVWLGPSDPQGPLQVHH